MAAKERNYSQVEGKGYQGWAGGIPCLLSCYCATLVLTSLEVYLPEEVIL